MKTKTRTVETVSINMVDGQQVVLDHEDSISSPNGTILLEQVADALQKHDFIKYKTQARYEKGSDEDWKSEKTEWGPAVCHIFSRNVTQVLTCYE